MFRAGILLENKASKIGPCRGHLQLNICEVKLISPFTVGPSKSGKKSELRELESKNYKEKLYVALIEWF